MNEVRSLNRFAASNNRTSSEESGEKAGLDEQGSDSRTIFWYLG